MIYFDNNATTRPDEVALQYALERTLECYGNPSSTHKEGSFAANLLEDARGGLAKVIGCKASELFFTSGGTESNNIALKQSPGRTFVGQTEHSSVLNYPNSYVIKVLSDGTTDLDHLESELLSYKKHSKSMGMVSIMLANNETGVISDPGNRIPALCAEHGVLLHVDAVQGFGKDGAPWNVAGIRADMISVSAHKVHGPKGIGALYVREGVLPRLNAVLAGGRQERGLRPGTENIMGAIAFARICWELDSEVYKQALARTSSLRNKLEEKLAGVTEINGGTAARIGNTSNLYFPEVTDVELFVNTLSEKGLCVSGKSACNSGMPEPSRVLTAMYGGESPRLDGSIRMSLSTKTTEREVDKAVEIIEETLHELKDLF